jgi:hypothetical protein
MVNKIINSKHKSKKCSRKSKVNNKTKSRSKSKSKSVYKSGTNSRVMRGGDDGRTSFSGSYFGNGTRGYFPEGSSELSSGGKQHAVSQGTIWEGGKYAGPNLYPTMAGGDCGCKRKPKNKKRKTKVVSRKNKSKKQSGGFWAQLIGSGSK